MEFIPTPLEGAFMIDLNKFGDERGFFARLFCQKEFARHGLESGIVQVNNSFSAKKGTLRGLHYQLAPYEETKLVRCIQGALYDVIVDLRVDSPTFKKAFGAVLSSENRLMMYVPKGFAHGFMTLEPDSEIMYFVSQFYSQEYERGVRWDDPAFAIGWPAAPALISERDKNHPDFDLSEHLNKVAR
ncbi:dTDP-4-dehydrorhamnose 3,5-epimerase [Parachlamydia sp. AcF125]|uniref:dTDP-4-dehydrorhamnose 3,5-epimerase n=1 Tax=Parachlamydia sp. AcF125 TaxID=2795736 RepID=UPI001BC9372F|nr:dTDP-4-dehydrorhamnose 3,5-epimerase [Parachlamydia sp. AcF125]